VTTAPSVTFMPSGVLGSDAARAAIPVSVTWTAKAGSSAICRQALTRAVGGGTPVAVKLGSATATDAVDTLTVGQTVRYAAQATGCDGLAGTATAGDPRVYKLSQQNEQWNSHSGPWSTLGDASAFSGGSIGETYASGASITFPMALGAAVALVGERGPHKGAARVYVDGAYLTTINNYAPVTAERRVLWTHSFGAPGPHTVTVVNVGTAGTGLGIDALAKVTA
jgi:hypothetical protein